MGTAAGGTGTTPVRGIVTPEAVVLEFETAGVGSRLLAAVLDLLIIFVGSLVLLTVLGFSTTITGSLLPSWFPTVLAIVSLFVVFFGYWIGFEAWNGGRTPGKAALGIRVVTVEGGPLSLRHATIRGLFRFVDFYLTSGVVGVLAATLSARDQRLGDRFAGTIVLRERALGSHAGALSFPPPQGYEGYVATLDVSALTPDQYGVIRSFLVRVFEVTPAARAALAERLAARVVERTGQPVPAAVHPELYLACVASAYQRRHGHRPPPPTATVPLGGWSAQPAHPTGPGPGAGGRGPVPPPPPMPTARVPPVPPPPPAP